MIAVDSHSTRRSIARSASAAASSPAAPGAGCSDNVLLTEPAHQHRSPSASGPEVYPCPGRSGRGMAGCPGIGSRAAGPAGLGATPMAVALAWLLQRSPNILLIPGISSVAHLRDNVTGAALTLSGAELTELTSMSFGLR